MSVRATLTHAQIYDNSVLTRSVGLAGFTVLVFDHLITLEDEVEYIWKGRKGPLIWLFFLNRYLVPLSFVVNLFAYFSHVWTYDTCARFVVYEGTMTMVGISISALMMFLRVRALYYNHRFVYCAVFALWCVFVGVNSWLLTTATPVFLESPHVISCTMIFDPAVGWVASSSAWLPLLYDTTVVLLTLIRTISAAWHRATSEIVTELLREGLLYYSVIFSVTLALTIMIATADPSVRNIAAQLELCLTATMMSRITLELKKFARGGTLAGQGAAGHARKPRDEPPPRDSEFVCAAGAISDGLGGIGRPGRAYTRESFRSAGAGTDTSFFALATRESRAGEDTSFFAMVTQDERPAAEYADEKFVEEEAEGVPGPGPSRKGKEKEVYV